MFFFHSLFLQNVKNQCKIILHTNGPRLFDSPLPEEYNSRMDFVELEAFLKLSQTLHFTKAAQEINLSPSALSRIISRLEEESGTLLFDRGSREVHLTSDGKKFAFFAEKALQEKKKLLEDFSKDADEVKGQLNVYASVTACYAVMPDFIRKISEKHPKIQLSIETGDPAAAIDAVRHDKADVAVAAIPESLSDIFECYHVLSTPLVFAASSSSPYVTVSGSPQDIVSSLPLILPKQGLARDRFNAWVKSRNVHPIIAAEAEGNEAVLALAALGLGMALVPQIVLEKGPYKSGFISHNAGNILGCYDVGFIQKKHVQQTSSAKKIRQAVNAIFASGIKANV